MQDSIRVGSEELLISHGASLQATRDLLAELGGRYVPKAREGLPANAMFIRGSNTAHPHGLHEAGAVQARDVLVTGAYGVVGGYESELERTMIVGEPDDRFRRFFAAMLAAQQVGLEALRPGRSCAEVEAEVRGLSVMNWAWTIWSATIPGTLSGWRDMNTLSWISTITRSSRQAWCFRWSRGCTSPNSPASGIPIRWSSPRRDQSGSACIRVSWKNWWCRQTRPRPDQRSDSFQRRKQKERPIVSSEV